ncbi:LOW QUALITY PROTEIN: PE family protein, partial [Mycobacterium tuberculosis GM 1503]
MSFLKTVPEELTAAAAQLGTIGAAMAAQNAAAAAPTTAIAPAALDEVSALQAALFTAYGTFYQQVSAEAQAMHDMFVNTLGISAGTYGVTESLNSSAAASPLSGITGESVGHHPSDDGGCLFRPNSRVALATSSTSGAGNWAFRHVYADRPCRRRPPACRGGGRGRLGSRWGSRLGRIGCIGRGRSRPRRGRNCGRPGQRIRDRHVVGAARLGRTGDPGIHHQHTAGRGLDRRRAAGRRGDVHPRDARGGLGRTQQRRLRCTALRRQTHRHAQASNRL